MRGYDVYMDTLSVQKVVISVVGALVAAVFFGSVPVHAAVETPYYYYYTTPGYTSPYTTPVQTYYQYQYVPQNQYTNQSQVEYLLAVLRQLQAQLASLCSAGLCGQVAGVTYSGYSDIDVTTLSATNIDRDEARLRGSIDFNSDRYAYAWFEWGTNQNNLNRTTSHIRYNDNDDTYSVRITNLDRNERYYFRAIGEDESGRLDYGAIRNFQTDGSGSSRNDDPDVTIESARNVTDRRAELRGRVDMNDFDNGIVFFVYGQDQSQVEDIAQDYDTYNDLDEDGDDLQKERVDSSLDGSRSYTMTLNGLDNNERYYFTLCVQYDDGDDVLECAPVDDFRTDP